MPMAHPAPRAALEYDAEETKCTGAHIASQAGPGPAIPSEDQSDYENVDEALG